MNSDLKKNYILFLVLSVFVIVGYSAFFGKSEGEKQLREKAEPNSVPAAGKFSEEQDFSQKAPREEFKTPDPSYSSEIIEVKSDLFIARIDTFGGKVVGWDLVKYKNTVESDSALVTVVEEGKKSFDTVLRVKGEKMPELIPFAYDGDRELIVGSEGLDVKLAWKSPEGLRVKKTISFYPDKYFIKENLEVFNGTREQITQKVYVNWENAVYENASSNLYEFVSMVEGEVKRTKKPLKEPKVFSGEVNWFGFSDKYFLSAFLPEIGGSQQLYLEPSEPKGVALAGFSYPEQRISGGRSYKVGWKSYFGPKTEAALGEAGYGLEESIDYGYVGALTKIAVALLKFVNNFFSNYGISINSAYDFAATGVFTPYGKKHEIDESRAEQDAEAQARDRRVERKIQGRQIDPAGGNDEALHKQQHKSSKQSRRMSSPADTISGFHSSLFRASVFDRFKTQFVSLGK